MSSGLPLVEWLQGQDLTRWDQFVGRHPLGLVYHSVAWKRILEEAFPHINGRFLGLAETESGGAILGGLPVYVVRSRLLGNRLVSVPWSSICDPLVCCEADFQMLLPQLRDLAHEVGARYTEIRVARNAVMRQCGNLCARSDYKHHYLSLAPSQAELLSSFHETAIKQMIKRAERNTIRCSLVDDQRHFHAFYRILTDTRQRLGLPAIPVRFFQAIQRHLSPANARLYVAKWREQPVGCLMVLVYGKMCSAEYSGDVPECRRLGVNQILYWHAIKQAKAEGCDTFSLGRTANANRGLCNYKRRWGSQEAEIGHLYDASSARQSHALGHGTAFWSLAHRLTRLLPATLNRLAGEIVYRHWG